MKLDRGINQDIQPIDQPEGTWIDARNIVFTDKYNSLVNEEGFEYLGELPGQPIGAMALDKDDWVVFIAGGTFDEIGIISNDTYTRIIRTPSVTERFFFNVNYPIKSKFRISNRGDRIIAFTDNLNPPRVLNITNLPFPVNTNKTPTQVGSINTLNLFTAGDPPVIDLSLNQTGGFLSSGTYLFSSSYTNVDGSETGYFTVSNPVKINDETGPPVNLYDGCPPGTITNKSIVLTLTEVDTRYKYLNIGVISVIGGVTKFQKVGQIEIVPGTTTYSFTFSGNEQRTDLLLEQITSQSQGIYQTAKAITVLNDQLVLGNLSSRPSFDYQSYANNILIRWHVEDVYDAGSFTNAVNVANLQRGGFRAFEVYAFYIVFRYKDGSYSPAYHIPGRVANPTDLTTSSLAATQGITAKKFQVEDTCLTDGTMSYWENESEIYPIDFPALAGQKVRHHKFPSLNFIATNGSALDRPDLVTDSGINKLPVLGFNAYNVNIPTELKAQIDGWQIYFAKRDIANQTCIGQGHLIFAHQEVTNTSEFSPNSNVYNGTINARASYAIFPYDSNPVNYKPIPQRRPALSKLTFHSADLLLLKPSISPSYVRNEIRLQARVTPGSNRYTPNGPTIFQHLIQNDTNINSTGEYMFLNYLDKNSTISAVASTGNDLIRRVTAGVNMYVPGNVITGNISNFRGSEYIGLDIVNGNTLSIASALGATGSYNVLSEDTSAPPDARRKEDTYLTNLCQLLKTVYSSYASQSLVSATNIISVNFNNTTTSFKFGDNYVSDYSFVATTGPTDVGDDIPLDAGPKVIRHYITESNINLKFRHEGVDANSKYYGKSSYKITNVYPQLRNSFLTTWDSTKPQILEYNSDYSVVNTFNPVFPQNLTINTLQRFPYRIILSEKNANELADSGWRTFLPNNYKDMLTTKGEIVNLEAYDDILLIHLENSLYRTVGAQTLKTSTEDVTIGSGQLFAVEPKEILTSELGYLGNQNRLGCGITKLGYIFFDASQGKLFAVSKEVKELSSKGLRKFFRDNMGLNPFTNVTYIPELLTKNSDFVEGSSNWFQQTGIGATSFTFTANAARVSKGSGTLTSRRMYQVISLVENTDVTIEINASKLTGTSGTPQVNGYFLSGATDIGGEISFFPLGNINGTVTTVQNVPVGAKAIAIRVVIPDIESVTLYSIEYIKVTGQKAVITTGIPDNPFTGSGYNMAFDEKYNRLLVSKKGAFSETLSYSPDIDAFVSFHDYVPDYMLNTRNKVFSIKGIKFYRHNHTNKATYYDVAKATSITAVFNDSSNLTKYFSTVNWQSEITKPDNTSLFNETFNTILISNSYQCSGEISLDQSNIKNAEHTWNFNKFYDIVINRNLPFKDSNGLISSNLNTSQAWFKQRKFVDKWTAVKLSYNNLSQNTLFLYDISMSMRQSSR